jgi:uncharacterized protein YecE (DUF72 family)
VPDGFRYAVKLSRFISHIRKLRDCREPLTTFLERMSFLGEKLAVILLQLPPSLRREESLLADFLVLLPGTCRFAVEFRDPSWFCRSVYDTLSLHNCALCLSHSARYHSEEAVTADFSYLRFHGPGRLYASHYSEEELSSWAGTIQRLAAGGLDVYAYFNNDFHGYAVENALTLSRMISA